MASFGLLCVGDKFGGVVLLMSHSNKSRFLRPTRRQMLGRMATAAAASSAIGTGLFSQSRLARAQDGGEEPHFLIVLGGTGGASIIDSFMAIRASECNTPEALNCFDDGAVVGLDNSPLRAVDLQTRDLGPIPMPVVSNQSDFLRKHQNDLLVSTVTGTSVNHLVAQRRAVTGNEAWRGRTLQEIVSAQYGHNFAMPNVHLLPGVGFSQRGTDESLPTYAYGETVANPVLWPLSLDGSAGVLDAPKKGLIERVRSLRNDQLDQPSKFARVFGQSPRIKHWQHLRGDVQSAFEANDLIRKLMFIPDSQRFPLSLYGLESSPHAELVRETFPDYAVDPLEAQAAMAFLLIKYRLSCAVTLGPSFDLSVADGFDLSYASVGGDEPLLAPGTIRNPPIAFDFSHQAHRAVQALMWNRLLKIADGLIDLLKAEEYANGQSLWDRTVLYIPTEFGRSRQRPVGARDFGTGHDLNNGVAILSPLVKGNTVLGGVDPHTGLTYGYDPLTGVPDVGRNMNEKHIFSGILQALKINADGANLFDMPAMLKNG